MAQLIVRDLEEKARLQRRAAAARPVAAAARFRQVIVPDTDVLSELMRRTPEARVVDWLDRQPVDSIWISSVTLFEIRLGLARLPSGRRRQALEASFARLVDEDLQNRILDLVDLRDTQIAGIALARRATLAMRNLRHFQDLDVPVLDPWRA